MIYKLSFEGGRIDWCTAESFLHLIKSYDQEYDLPIQEIESIDEISEEEAKVIMVRNADFDEDNSDDMPEELSLYDLGGKSDDFMLIASSEFD